MNMVQNIDEIYRQNRDGFPEAFRLRVRRAISWLNRAEALCFDGKRLLGTGLFGVRRATQPLRLTEKQWQERELIIAKSETDWDLTFVSLWIAFNAIYARDFDLKIDHDRVSVRDFFYDVCYLDTQQQIYQLVLQKFSSDIREFLNNRYVFQSFWDFHNGLISKTAFEDDFQKIYQKTNEAFANQDTESLLALIFNGLYTLRNQIMYGGVTWNSSANRIQIRFACAFLRAVLPIFIQIMMAHPSHEPWGKPFYPFVVKED